MPISLVLVDDHAALREGVRALLVGEPDLDLAATAATGRDGFSTIAELQPQVAVIDHHLPDEDGFTLCLRTRALPAPPRVVIYTAFTLALHPVLAAVAGASRVVAKSAPPEELLSAIRAEGAAPPRNGIDTGALRDAGAQLEPGDRAILAMLAHGTAPGEVAATLTMDASWLQARRWAVLERLAGKPTRRRRARI